MVLILKTLKGLKSYNATNSLTCSFILFSSYFFKIYLDSHLQNEFTLLKRVKSETWDQTKRFMFNTSNKTWQ